MSRQYSDDIGQVHQGQNKLAPSAEIMKKVICIIVLLLCALPFIGVYHTRWIEDNQVVFFIKKVPTYKVIFVNVFRSDHEDHWGGYLEGQERRYAIDFCKYYLDYDTSMNSMDDFYQCKKKYEKSLGVNPPNDMQHDSWDVPG